MVVKCMCLARLQMGYDIQEKHNNLTWCWLSWTSTQGTSCTGGWEVWTQGFFLTVLQMLVHGWYKCICKIREIYWKTGVLFFLYYLKVLFYLHFPTFIWFIFEYKLQISDLINNKSHIQLLKSHESNTDSTTRSQLKKKGVMFHCCQWFFFFLNFTCKMSSVFWVCI